MRREALSGAGRSPGRKLPQYNQGHRQTEQHAAGETFRDRGEPGEKSNMESLQWYYTFMYALHVFSRF